MEQTKELDSMYAAYRKEFENVQTVFIPSIGFSNWKLETDGVYIQEVYVRPEVRGNKNAAYLTQLAINQAMQIHGKDLIKIAYTTIALGGTTIDASLRAVTDFGFKLLKADNELIYFYKEIINE